MFISNKILRPQLMVVTTIGGLELLYGEGSFGSMYECFKVLKNTPIPVYCYSASKSTVSIFDDHYLLSINEQIETITNQVEKSNTFSKALLKLMKFWVVNIRT